MEKLYKSIRSAIVDGKPLWCDDPAVVSLANRHDLGHLVSASKSMEAVYRSTLREHTLGEIVSALGRSAVPHVLLKGAVICALYPEAWMRTSADLDVLVKEADLERASAALAESGFKFIDKANNHSVFESPDGVTLELHFSLEKVGMKPETIEVLSHIWDEPNSQAMFYCYTVAHMANHFLTGGCGLRSIIDIWLMRDFDRSLIEPAGLGKFENEARKFAEFILGDSEPNEPAPNEAEPRKSEPAPTLDRDFEEWILNGGVFGTLEQATISRTSNGNKSGTMLRRLFPSYKDMQIYFPDLDSKAKLPIYWAKRVRKHTGRFGVTRIKKELSAAHNSDRESSKRTQDLMHRLELK